MWCRHFEKTLKKRGHSVDFIHETNKSLIPSEELLSCEVAIEFTGPENAVDNLTFCAKHGSPVVSGTTGWLEQWNTIQAVQEKYQAKIQDLPLGDLIAFIPAVESTPLGGGLFIFNYYY